MKKLYLLLVLVIMGLQTTFAQLVWHPNLGTAPSGVISLAWNETSYTIIAEDGDEFTPGGAGESINQQLLELEIRWIRVQYVDSAETGTYHVTLQLSPNTTGSERSVAFGTYASHLLIQQKAQNSYPLVDWPANHCFYICPGERVDITLHNTTLNTSYYVWQTYEDDVPEECDFFNGTGGDYTYNGIGSPGTYCFDFPNSDFMVKYYEAFDYVYDAGEEILSADPNGGVYRYTLTKYWKDGTIHPVYDLADVAFFDAPFDIYNSGGSTAWNPHMRISYGYDDSRGKLYLEIYCPPNLSATTIRSATKLRFDDDMSMEVQQSGGGKVLVLPVVYTYNEATAKVAARIDNSQPDVVYTLYRDGIKQVATLGDGGTISLLAPKTTGYYHVTALYEENGLSASAEMEGAKFVGGCMAVLPTDRNWIFSQTYNSNDKHAYDLTYYDGLGYAEQEIGIGAVANGTADLVRPIVYDLHHREARKYLPYARTNGNGVYDPQAITRQEAFYRSKFSLGSAAPYAFVFDEYEASPIGRILRSRKPGREFQTEEHSVRNNYFANGESSVSRLDVDPATNTLHVNGYYAANMLSGVRTTDEDGAVAVTYTDKEGHAVYEERQLRGEGNTVDRIVTRYVYDDCGRLAWVVTPEGVDRLVQGQTYASTSDVARNYCYVYTYDERGRQIEKRMPGRAPEYMVYDRGDRLVMSQDGNMRAKKQWMIYKYDYLNRPTQQSLATDTSTTDQTLRYKEFCEAFASQNPPALYTGTSTLVRKYAYDHYNRVPDAALGFEHVDGLTRENGVSLQDVEVHGLPVYEQLAVLTDNGIRNYHDRAYYYDYKGRIIQQVEKISSTEILRTTSKYDLAGNLLAQRESYTQGNATSVLNRTFEYDTRNRLTKETAQYNNGELAVVNHTYDNLGQLTGTTYGTGSHAIHETMDYNLQGWLTGKNNELFEMKLNYFEAYRDWLEPHYSGNISTWIWQHKLIDGMDDDYEYAYGYRYDDLSRLTAAEQFYWDMEGPNDDWTENGITYDKNSNILTLNRSSRLEEDDRQFEFSYIGNQRDEELGEGRSYIYDANGNMTQDGTNYFLVSYNFLNLPSWMDTYADYTNIYDYLVDGTKIRHEAWDGRNHAYRGSLVYNNGQFESASFGGGRIVGTNNGLDSEVHYFLTDHLGSTRVVAKVTPTGRADLDRRDYYPFGKEWRQTDMPASDNRYMFSGKERSDICLENDYSSILPIYDFGARNYYPEGVFFLQQDPLMHKYYPIGQYVYCAGNPVKYIDPDGNHPAAVVAAVMVKAAVTRAVIGAAIDITAQVVASRLTGSEWSETIQGIDWTSVGTAAVTSALTTPGVSTGAKIGGVALEGINAAVDYSQKDGLQYLGKGKSMTDVAIDAATPAVVDLGTKKFIGTFSKSIANDLTSKSAATLSKAAKNELKQLQKIVDSKTTKFVIGQFGNLSMGIEFSILKEMIEPENTIKNGTTIQEDHKND